MKIKQIIVGTGLFIFASTSSAFEMSDLSEMLFEDTATGIGGKLKDAEFEFRANRTILLDKSLQNRAHLVVSRNRGSVLIAGQAETHALKGHAVDIVLSATQLKWKEGDVNHVEPANARVCNEASSSEASPAMPGNARRRAILKTASTTVECSTVNRFYNEISVGAPLTETQISDEDVLRATIVNKLLHEGIIERANVIKVVVSARHVYLLGDELSQGDAGRASEFVKTIPDVEKVSPLFRF
ncbi:MAG: transport-associated protein [Cycloclasticus sp. symbiont of Poecilosclerida sp. M]|nr:MAG: transport-associated protein [Cycloclasticus sp. symbiont of Poecilosclerida sp. M]